MLCPLWDPIVFAIVEYILVKIFEINLILFIKCVIIVQRPYYTIVPYNTNKEKVCNKIQR